MTKPLPCPFCGVVPAVRPLDWRTEGDAWGAVECIEPDCVANPRVEDGEDIADSRGSAAYKEVAIKRWNAALSREPS